MEQDIKNILDEHSQKIDKIYVSVEKTRKYFLWTLVISAVFFILPLIGITILAPIVLGTMSAGL